MPTVRANQRDIYHVSSLREQTEAVLRSWLGQCIRVVCPSPRLSDG